MVTIEATISQDEGGAEAHIIVVDEQTKETLHNLTVTRVDAAAALGEVQTLMRRYHVYQATIRVDTV